MPAWAGVAVGVAGAAASSSSASSAAGGAQSAAERLAYQNELRNRQRFGQAQQYLEPYIGESRQAQEQLMVEMGLAPGEGGTAYMETPAYQAAISEGIGAVNQGAAGAGTLYSGRRGIGLRDVGAGVQGQYYTNYMNMLQNMASPQVAQNLSSLGVGQGLQMGQQNLAAQQMASNYSLMGAQAQGAAIADVAGGLTNLYSGYMGSQPSNRPANTALPASNPGNYSAYV